MCPHETAHWRNPANMNELSVCCGDVVLCQITFDHLLKIPSIDVGDPA